MAVQASISVEEFERIAALPENANKRLEYIGGEIVEVVSNSLSWRIAIRIAARISAHVESNHLGFVTGADGGYRVSGEHYMPDVGFIARAQHPRRPRETWVPFAPDLAVEVISPTDRVQDIADKVANYLLAGTLLWCVYPGEQQVKVYMTGQPVRAFSLKDTLDGDQVLPGFKLDLTDIFPAD